MAAPRKYPDELRERATRLAVEARQDPAGRAGTIRRIAEQLGIHPEALRTWFNQRRLHGELGHVTPAERETAYTPATTPEPLLKTR